MPPEFPETQRPDENTASAAYRTNDRPQNPTDRHKYDELIAVFVALLGMGSLLFWGLNSGKGLSWLKSGTTGNVSGQVSGPASGQTGAGLKAGDGSLAGNAGEVSGVKGRKPEDVAAVVKAAESKPASNGAIAGTAAVGSIGAAGLLPGVANAESAPDSEAQKASPEVVAVSPVPVPSSAVVVKTPPVPPKATETPTLEKPGKAKFFRDVPEGSAIAPYVAVMSSRGLISGFGDTFKPDQPVTRAEFASMVTKSFEKARTKDKLVFSDVAADSKLLPAVDEAVQTGFMKGYSKTLFNPGQQIPMAQLQVALVTGMGLSAKDAGSALAKFGDAAEVPKWGTGQVAAAVEAGILLPDAKVLEPNRPATRADAAILIHQALVKDGKLPAIKP
jgi:hypothetical protein